MAKKPAKKKEPPKKAEPAFSPKTVEFLEKLADKHGLTAIMLELCKIVDRWAEEEEDLEEEEDYEEEDDD